MRFARTLLFATLNIIILCTAIHAQTPRLESDPRNVSPSVGTGGPEGGPTGLFTIYDGQTLRKGEFTFSVAYSNFDRDPGNLDIVETPISFNIGLNDYIELFFKTTGYKGIKVNSPLNLSGFYLPNSRVYFGNGLLGSPPAIILAPNGPNVGTIRGTAIFRPAFCPACTAATGGAAFAYFNGGQPFIQYPFTGGAGSTFGLTAGAGNAGFPGFSATLGPPVATANNGTFGSAAAFPGVGAPVGGILPGIVLSTTTLPATLIANPTVVPATFTTSPAYYPGAPFLNRLYGESSFTDGVVGAKIRFTELDNPLGVGIIPFYRYWWDKGNDLSGFNQMQRGAGPGGDIGDFGLVGFLDARLSRSVNVSVNGGYILNSNPKDPNGFVLLDRPDEFIAGIGFDFPINKYWQPIFELRSTQYVGGRTPNAFENSPVEFTAGTKIYPRRWWGIGLWYRRHINQQRQNLFEGANFNTQINQVTNVDLPGPPPLVIVPGTTVAATVNEFPRGFQFSDDANGFGFQFFIGKRYEPITPREIIEFEPRVTPPTSEVILPATCRSGERPKPGCTPTSTQITFNASIENATAAPEDKPDEKTPLTPGEIATDFNWSWTIEGTDKEKVKFTPSGASATADFSDVPVEAGAEATFTITAIAEYACGAGACSRRTSSTVTVRRCSCEAVCPTVTVSCPDTVYYGDSATFTANVVPPADQTVTYTWEIPGIIITPEQQNKPTITITTAGLDATTTALTATLTIRVGELYCPPVSCTVTIIRRAVPRLFDSYCYESFNDEKARLDNFVIQLNQEPGAKGIYVITGGCRAGQAQQYADRARNYMVSTRGFDPGRIEIRVREDNNGHVPGVQLWIIPQGAEAPTETAISAKTLSCPACKVSRPRTPQGRKRRRPRRIVGS